MTTLELTFDDLLERARALWAAGGRRLLGLVGAPGAGKSSVAAALAAALPGSAVVPMDGFHLANEELERLGRRGRKGAPDTFDAAGYVALLRRLREPGGETVYAPRFDRSLETSVGSALPVGPEVGLIITEGNYLLLDGAWAGVRAALDAVWYLDPPDGIRLDRLVSRHEAFGKAPEEARRWVEAVDQPNAARIAASRERANLIVRLVGPLPGV